MITKLARSLVILIAVWFVVSLTVDISQAQDLGPITQRIMDDDVLRCGVNSGLPGFGNPDASGNFVGFDVDFCRAVAAAILGDASKVAYIPLAAGDRENAIVNETVDMLSRNTTFTLTRDAQWNAIFGPVVFYDGQGVMVFSESGITSIEILSGGTICVADNTTTALNIQQEMALRGLTADFNLLPDTQTAVDTFLSGRCDAYTGDLSAIIVQKGLAEDPDSLSILDIQPISKEPLAPVTPASDPQFANIVRWVIFGMIEAEELGISSQNVEAMSQFDNVNVQRLLGSSGAPVGDLLGINNDFMADVIAQVGNYGEVYDRHLGTQSVFRLPRGLNELWINGGLLYAPPFR